MYSICIRGRFVLLLLRCSKRKRRSLARALYNTLFLFYFYKATCPKKYPLYPQHRWLNIHNKSIHIFFIIETVHISSETNKFISKKKQKNFCPNTHEIFVKRDNNGGERPPLLYELMKIAFSFCTPRDTQSQKPTYTRLRTICDCKKLLKNHTRHWKNSLKAN